MATLNISSYGSKILDSNVQEIGKEGKVLAQGRHPETGKQIKLIATNDDALFAILEKEGVNFDQRILDIVDNIPEGKERVSLNDSIEVAVN